MSFLPSCFRFVRDKIFLSTVPVVAQVIPPKGWKARVKYNNNDIDKFIVKHPISQVVSGAQGSSSRRLDLLLIRHSIRRYAFCCV